MTLEVLGSFLCGVESKSEWESALEKLGKVPPGKVQETLKISYDGLDGKEKTMFLDTACFFVGEEKKCVVDIWEACSFYHEIGLNVLIESPL